MDKNLKHKKNFAKALKRKARQKIKRLDITVKTGRMKVAQRLQKEYLKRVAKQEQEKVVTSITEATPTN